MRAFSAIRKAPFYRHDAFLKGLAAAGHEVHDAQPDRFDDETLFVCWNRYGGNHDLACRVEAGGGRVIVAENGYINGDGSPPKFSVHPGGPKPADYYAIGLGYHNDAERVRAGGRERFDRLGLMLTPWRTCGDHILVAANRAFGAPGRAMATDWADRTAARLGKETKRRIVIRRHPGNDVPKRPVSADLDNAWAVVVWSSSVAVHALAAGIPTFIEAPFHIVKGASATGSIEAPTTPGRRPWFERMAWGQWRVDEIEQGVPFRHLFTG